MKTKNESIIFILLIIILIFFGLKLYTKYRIESTLKGGIANPKFQTDNGVDLTKIDYSKLSNIEFSNLVTKAQDREDIVAIKNLGFRT
jgi:hypothetical protein